MSSSGLRKLRLLLVKFVEMLNNIESIFQAGIIAREGFSARTINLAVMINIRMVYCDLSRSAENICIPETVHFIIPPVFMIDSSIIYFPSPKLCQIKGF